MRPGCTRCPGPVGAIRGRAALAVVAALAVLLLVPAGDGSAAEEITARELGLEVTAGFGGHVYPGTWLPVSVTLAPQRLFAGRLEVAAQQVSGNQLIEARDVEVAAGSRKLYRFLLPPSQGVNVRAAGDGSRSVSVRAEAQRVGSSSFLVGVLGTVPRDAPGVESVGARQRAVYVDVDPAWLQLSPRTLDSLGTLVATTSDLQELADGARRNLATAVTSGLDLTVVVDRLGPVDFAQLGLPASPVTAAADSGGGLLSLTPADGTWSMVAGDSPAGLRRHPLPTGEGVVAASVLAGRGRVAAVGVPLGGQGPGSDPDLWSHLLQPSAQLAGDRSPEPPIAQILHRSQEALAGSGLGVPALPWLAAFLLAYVLVVGPLNGFVLSRLGRRELAWVTVPAVTVGFGAIAFAASAAASPPAGLATRAIYWIDGQGTELAVGAVRAPTPGGHVLHLADHGWDVAATSFRTAAEVDRDGEDVAVRFDLEALEVATVLGWRPTTAPAPLEVEAQADDRSVRATVRNRGDVPLTDVALLAGTQRTRVGDLPPGEERTVEVPAAAGLRVMEPWGEDVMDRGGPDGLPEPPGSLAMLLRWEVLDRHPGLVWASATSDRRLGDGAVAADGRAADELGTLVVVGARPRLAGAVPPIAVQRTVTAVSGHGGGDPHWLSTTAIEGVESVVVRFRLPAVGQVTALTGTLERGFQEHGFFPPEGMPPAVPVPAVTCDPNGICVEAEQAVPPPIPPELRDPPQPVAQQPVELYDVSTQRWVPLAEAFQAGQADPARFLSALGEVHVRGSASGLFDLSGRGVGAVLAGGP